MQVARTVLVMSYSRKIPIWPQCIVQADSKSLTFAEKGYAVIEYECLVVVWVPKRAYSCSLPQFTVILDTDRWSLFSIQTYLADIENPCLYRLHYKLVVRHKTLPSVPVEDKT